VPPLIQAREVTQTGFSSSDVIDVFLAKMRSSGVMRKEDPVAVSEQSIGGCSMTRTLTSAGFPLDESNLVVGCGCPKSIDPTICHVMDRQVVMSSNTRPIDGPLGRDLRNSVYNGFQHTFPMCITPIKPLQRAKKSIPLSNHVTEVIVAVHFPHIHTGGEPRQTRL